MSIREIKITNVSGESKVIARASVSFDSHAVRGFKILRDDSSKKEFVTAPSFFNGFKWIPLFKTHNKADWEDLCSQILKKYNEMLISEVMS